MLSVQYPLRIVSRTRKFSGSYYCRVTGNPAPVSGQLFYINDTYYIVYNGIILSVGEVSGKSGQFEFVRDVGLEKRSENIRIQWNENRIPEKVEWESSSVP